VRFTGGPFTAQYDAHRTRYLALSNDSMLKGYHQAPNLLAPRTCGTRVPRRITMQMRAVLCYRVSP